MGFGGISIWSLLIILVIFSLPVMLIIFLVKRSRVKSWLMRKSEARYFQEEKPKK